MSTNPPVRDLPRVGVVTTSSAELEHLAEHLHQRRLLAAYVHPYLSKAGVLESMLRSAPIKQLDSQPGKRSIPKGVADHLVHSAAPMEEILRAALGRRIPNVSRRLMDRRTRRLSKVAAKLAAEVDVLVVSHASALEAFQAPAGRAIGVLNQPSIHPRVRIRILDEEAERFPLLASTMVDDRPSEGMLERFDLEFQLADHILVGSDFAKSTLVSQDVQADSVSVIPYGVDLALFYPHGRDEPLRKFRVMYVGRLTQAKGVGYLLDAYEEFRRGDTCLTLLGRPQGGIDAFRKHGADFFHLAAVPRSHLRRHYADASVVVLPSLFEGMAMVVLEAMACGVPVIVTNRGPDQVVRDGIDGFVVPAGDSHAIAERLDMLYENSSLLLQMGKAARARAEMFTWRAYADNVLATLERLMA